MGIFLSGTSQFSAITAVSFSPIRPLVFAVASAEGFLYIYDLLSNTTSPVAMLEAPLVPPVSLDEESDANPTSPVGRGKKSSSRTRADQKKSAIAEGDVNRVGITGIAFNQKQRDLIAACDHLGRIHIWRLNWKLSNLQQGEQVLLNVFGNVAEAMDN